MSSQFDADILVASAPILMLSPPETQDTPQDVFHTPPEEQSLPSSLDVEPCAVNEVFHAFSQTQGSVDLSSFSQGSDLGGNSELGFSEAQLSQEIVTKLVPNCSPVRVSEREISDLGESPAKKLKLLDQNLGKLVSDADMESVVTRENGIGCDQIDVLVGEGEDFCQEKSIEKIESIEEKFETEAFQGAELPEESNEEHEHASRRVLPVSVKGEARTEVESSEVKEKAVHSLFDILKALAEDTDEEEDEDEDNGDVNSLFTALKESGITFPRPRWWPDHFKSVLPVEKAAKREIEKR